MTIDDLIRALETAAETAGDLAPMALQDDSGCVYEIGEVYVSAEHGTVTLVAKDSGHFN